jgi:GT2 family glycosyltransferase
MRIVGSSVSGEFMDAGPSIAVLMTSFNRCDKTLKAIASLSAQATNMPRRLQIFLVDDGSSDGTSSAVATQFPEVQIICGTGSLYWNGGMRLAFDHALKIGFDAYLWLNDDTELFPNALDTLLRTDQLLNAEGTVAIVTGSTCDPVTGERTYGGFRRINRVFFYQLIYLEPLIDRPLCCDTMNGNFTLIPKRVADSVGNLEPGYQHHFGDADYGYRAKNAGFSIYVAPGYLGSCSSNSIAGTWRDRSISVKRRWKDLMSVKGYRFSEWLLFCTRNYRYLGLIHFMVPYVKASLPRKSNLIHQATE